MLEVNSPSDEPLRRLLDSHPGVRLIPEASPVGELLWSNGTWNRRLSATGPDGVGGLVELADNNPLVCADSASFPTGGASLALIALGPLIRAQLIVADPVLAFTFEPEIESVREWMKADGWPGDLVISAEPQDLGSVRGLTSFVEIATPEDWRAIDELFAEAYGRSFYVRVADDPWDPRSVAGGAHAIYRLRMTPDEPVSLLTVQVAADVDGKIGAAGLVHAFNVMNGFEECLGLPR